jgi:hypothetical protein
MGQTNGMPSLRTKKNIDKAYCVYQQSARAGVQVDVRILDGCITTA